MQHLGGKLALKSACRIALNCPARNTVGSMETQLREPDTRANVAAWVTYAASLSEDEQWEHRDECPITFGGDYDKADGGKLTDCPLCNAIFKLKGMPRRERRLPERYRNADFGYTSRVPLRSLERAMAALYDAAERHARRIVREALNSGRVAVLEDLAICKLEYHESRREDYAADIEELVRDIAYMVTDHVRKINLVRCAPVELMRSGGSHAHTNDETLWRALMAIAITLHMILHVPRPSMFQLWRLDTTVPADKSSTLLVVSMQRAPRAPQPCPCCGNIPAVVLLAD